jgi:hypothetical protein
MPRLDIAQEYGKYPALFPHTSAYGLRPRDLRYILPPA